MNAKKQAAALLAALLLLTPAVQAAEAAPTEEAVPTETETAAPQEPSGLDAWNMLLVNPWNSLPEGFSVELGYLANGMQVDKRILPDLNAMLDACREAGLRPMVCSAYRSNATQTRLHNNKIYRLRASGWDWADAPREAARWVAVPGTSEHQTGLAVDIVASSYQVLNKKQEQTAEQKWLMEHCWEYGFILRYPSEKSEITGIGYEPWHYRYVGRETALAIRESGLCMEEYIEALRAAETPAAPAVPVPAESVPAPVSEEPPAPEGLVPESTPSAPVSQEESPAQPPETTAPLEEPSGQEE